MSGTAKVRKSYELDKDLDRWYKENYPGVSLWWITNALLRAFKDLHTAENPRNIFQDHFDEASRNVQQEITK